MIKRSLILAPALLCSLTGYAAGAESPLKKEPRVPAGLAFVRTIDLELFGQRTHEDRASAQTFRFRTRYLDPDVNAFVGMLTSLSRFDHKMRLADPPLQESAHLLWDWGIDLGVRRGYHIWELDLMGAMLSRELAFAPAIVGEHGLVGPLWFYHRTQLAFFPGDTLVDADQGFEYRRGNWGFTAGYRVFSAAHMNRSGPRAGVSWRFSHPKIPFLFPSLG